ncbi:ABC transporter permease [Salinispora oceanensis]|uniref:ABC transporter permease n=1 Tax=Salinispora oceanensis TaxID=1050199 RepID=UPI0003768315|nr:ABC transporter permease [Salinispora oceanensis]
MSTATTPPEDDTAADYTPVPDRVGALLNRRDAPNRPSALAASLAFCWRALLKIKHVPEQMIDVTVFPIIITLMFTFLFGGALAGSTREYVQFLLPGIMVISVLMITMYTGMGINTDVEKGIFDRFRTLPIWRPAALVGALLGDVLRYVLAATVIVLLGLVLGYRPSGGATGMIAAMVLVIVFAFAFSWIWIMFGLLLRSEKSVMAVSMPVLFPLTFLSNVFVDPSTMPGWLQAFVKVNPITHLVTATRQLAAGTWDTGELAWVLVSCAVLIVVFGTISIRLYNRK